MTYITMEELPELDMAALPDYPVGFMKPHATKKCTVEQLIEGRSSSWDLPEDEVRDQHLNEIKRIRAWFIERLMGKVLVFHGEQGFSESFYNKLEYLVPGVRWNREDKVNMLALKKYGLFHQSIDAPVDTATGQPMCMEIVGSLIRAGDWDLATKAGRDALREWPFKRVEVMHEDGSREMDYAYLHEPLPTPFSIHINVATYANISFPGIGVPLYL